MQRLRNTLLTLLMVALAATMTACGGGGGDDPQLTPEEERLLALAGSTGTTWNAVGVTFDSAPDDRFDNFSLTLRGTDPEAVLNYSSQNGDPVFKPSGTWEITGVSSTTTTIIIDSNTNNVFTISNLNTSVTPATMTITVDFTSGGGVAAGSSGTDGRYVFNMQAQ